MRYSRKHNLRSMRIFREGLGITAAFITVMAFILVGFAQMTAVVLWGLTVAAPDAWFSGLLSLSSACMGYLIGKNIENQQIDGPYYDMRGDDGSASEGTTCPHCGMPIEVKT
ncbi:hypothetical protein [Synechococcus phage Ssp-JY38]|nr:hypothetical protein [Synechococcus phage Yong-L2-223]